MPRPSARLLRVMIGLLEVGGMRLLKSSRRRAEALGVLPATGVLPAIGVRFCEINGLSLIKSLKQKFVPGVVGPKPKKPLPAVTGVI